MPDRGKALEVRVLGQDDWIAVGDVCRLCLIEMTAVVELVDLGLVASRGAAPPGRS